jgi:hypothetical protein
MANCSVPRLMTPLWIDHKFQKVAIWISYVNAGASSLAAALALNWSFNNFCCNATQHVLKRFGRAVPHKAQVPARRFCGGSSQRECLVLPVRGAMKVDHLVPDVDRTRVCVLDHLQAEASIEGKHLLCMLHGKGNMIESSDSCSPLCDHLRSASQCTCGGYATDEPSP